MGDAKALACKTREEAERFVIAMQQLGYPNIRVVGEVDGVGMLPQQDAKWLVVAAHSEFLLPSVEDE